MSTTVLENDSSADALSLTSKNESGSRNRVGDTRTEMIKITTHTNSSSNGPKSDIGPINKKTKSRTHPYAKPILLAIDRTTRKKKSISWSPEESLKKIHYFELIPDERTNVNRVAMEQMNSEVANSCLQSGPATSPNAHANRMNPMKSGVAQNSIDGRRPSINRPENNEPIKYTEWRLILIDFTPELPSPGWNSLERSAQAERETYVLGAIDLPGQPSTIDEPDTNTGGEQTSKDEAKIIPLDNLEGMYTEYPDMYNSEIVNGVRAPSGSPAPAVSNIAAFNGQTPQLLPDQFQQQLVNVIQNPFTFQEMSAQFQQQQPQQFPFAAQQQSFQTPFTTQSQVMQPQQSNHYVNHPQMQQAQPQPGLPGPIMPWLNYPFNQVNENSHVHLFRRPTT